MIASFPLCQRAAPRFFEVDTTSGRVLFITFRGLGWVEYQKNLDGCTSGPSGRGELVGLTSQDGAAPLDKSSGLVGSNPTPSTSLTHGGQPKQKSPGAAGRLPKLVGIDQGQRPPPGDLSSQVGTGNGSKPTASETADSRADSAPELAPGECNHRGKAQAPGRSSARPAQFTSRMASDDPAPPAYRTHADLRARLDRARDAYDAARANLQAVSGDDLLRLQEVYCGLIEELDRVDAAHWPVDRLTAVVYGRTAEERREAFELARLPEEELARVVANRDSMRVYSQRLRDRQAESEAA
jgi:hypothetical protein